LNRRLFEDVETPSFSSRVYEVQRRNIDSIISSSSISDASYSSIDDQISEFSGCSIKELVEKKKNKFVFDPENGGGRTRRVKKVSRIEMM
jgi:hypothetical protein